MSSLADLPDLVGFFSYSRSDDEHSDGALSLLRKRIRSELRLQLGRELRLWQDIEAIPLGSLWEGEIRKAIAESAFFIPIISPSALNSKFCRMEFEAFLARERELGRDDVVFPILYIPVPGLANAGERGRDDVLRIIHARQYADWTDIQLDDAASSEVRKEVARFCKGVVEALRKAWESPEERRRREEAEARRLAEEERQRAKEERRRQAEAVAQRLKKQEEARRIAEAEARRLAEEERRRTAEAEAQRRAGAAGSASGVGDGTSAPTKQDIGALGKWWLSPRALVAAGVFGLILMGLVLGWLVMPSGALRQPLTAAQERALKPKDSFRECADCPEMVVVPAGAFTMGSPENEAGRYSDEGPQHIVTISKPFAVGKLHVTVDQFAAFASETGYVAHSGCSWRNPGFAQEGSHPAVCLSWDDAKAYVDWLAKKTGKPYRMLTEAEWEYAARGRTSPGAYPRFWFGDDEKELCLYGNFRDQKAGNGGAPCNTRYAYTSPAGHYQPNAFGLYDMFGNAWQWTADCWHDSYDGAPSDGSAWTSGSCSSGRVVRGGSWVDVPAYLRSAQRYRFTVEYVIIGFRLARTLTP